MESKHTKGAAIIHEPQLSGQIPIQGGDGRALCFIPPQHPNAKANADLIAEAFNVANETGKTPRELQEENERLSTILLPSFEDIELAADAADYKDEQLEFFNATTEWCIRYIKDLNGSKFNYKRQK